MTHDDLAAHARALLDANGFPTLGTVDPDGRPWTSPVYFAAAGVRLGGQRDVREASLS